MSTLLNDPLRLGPAAPPAWPDNAAAFDPEGFDPGPTNPAAVIPYEDEAPLVTGDFAMPDWEAHLCLEKITTAQLLLAETDRLAKQRKAEIITDLKGFLGNYDRPARLAGWRAINAGRYRKKVTTLKGELSETRVKARCVVEDAGLAEPWLKKHAPAALVVKIDPKKLPAPVSAYTEHGEIEWKAPGPGLKAEPERDEVTVNGKRLDVLLRGKGEESEDSDG